MTISPEIASVRAHYRTQEEERTASQDLTLEREQTTLGQIYALLQSIALLQHRHHQDLINEINEDISRFKEESDEVKKIKYRHGWSTATLTVVGAICGVLGAPTLFSDTTREFLKSGAQLTDGVKTVQSLWNEGRLTQKDTVKQFLQNAYQLGQRATEQSDQFVKELNNIMLRIQDIESKTKFSSLSKGG